MDTLFQLDAKVFEFVNQLVGINGYLDATLIFLSVYLIYLLPFFLVVLWFVRPKLREISLRAALVGVIGWQVITPLVAKLWFRERPIDNPLVSSREIVFHRPTYSFPSDHALFLFALATGFYFAGRKKIGIGLYIVALIISFSRVVVGVHFPLDVVVGGLIGVGLAWLAWRYRAQIDPIIVKPLMTIAKFLRLA